MANQTQHEQWEAEILAQLDRCAQDYNFPMPDNAHVMTADMRLKAYRSREEWLIVFEQIEFAITNAWFENGIAVYGNKLAEPGHKAGVICVSAPGSQHLYDDEGNFLLNTREFTVEIKGKEHRFTPRQKDYLAAGIHPESGMDEAVRILRYISYKIPDKLYLPDKELLGICGRTKAGLEKFIELHDWYHPNLADDELPSESPCFRSLARALAQGNTDLYECPTDTHNTHWSNWLGMEMDSD